MFNFEKNHLPERWKEGNAWRNYWRISRLLMLGLLVGGFHVMTFAVPQVVPQLEPLSTGNRFQLTGIWSSFVLTFALITVYRDMNETQTEQVSELREQRELQEELTAIQDRQAEIMSYQQELMEGQHEPIIEVIAPAFYGGFAAYKMRNIGRGPATNLEMLIHIYVPETGFRMTTGPDQLSHIEELGDLQPPQELEEFSNSELAEISSLTPGQTGVLAAEVHTYGPNEELDIDLLSSARGLGGLTRRLSRQGGRWVYYQVEICFDHQMRTRGKGRLYLDARETEVTSEAPISSLLAREESEPLPIDRFPSSEFEEPGVYFDEP